MLMKLPLDWQRYSDTSPFSIPCRNLHKLKCLSNYLQDWIKPRPRYLTSAARPAASWRSWRVSGSRPETWCQCHKTFFFIEIQWKRISHKQSARWQHLSRLKASAFFFLQKIVSCMKCNNLYSGLVTPSSGWCSPVGINQPPVSASKGQCCKTFNGRKLWIFVIS
jgi:hypothetical protein